MRTYMYVCVYVCRYVCVYVCVSLCGCGMYASIYTRLWFVCVFVYELSAYTCLQTRIHVRMYIYTCTGMCISVQ